MKDAALRYSSYSILSRICDHELRDEIFAVHDSMPDGALSFLFQNMAKTLHFREKTLEGLKKEKLVELMHIALPGIPRGWLMDLLKCYHFECCRPLMGAFLDVWGIKHDNGNVAEVDQTELSIEMVQNSLMQLKAQYELRRCLVYYSTAGAVMPCWQKVLWDVVDAHIDAVCAAVPDAKQLNAKQEKMDSIPVLPVSLFNPEATNLSALDHLLIKATVASISKIEGSFSQEQLLDIVNEYVHLNADRHRSYFHLGFHAGLNAHEVDFSQMPEMNPSRMDWLLTGMLHAFERKRDSQGILDLYNKERDAFHSIFSSKDYCAPSAGKILFNALWRLGEYEKAACLPGLVFSQIGPVFLKRVLFEAAAMLRSRKPDVGRLLVDKIYEALKFFDENDIQDHFGSDFLRELVRRNAQCQQTTGHFDKASELIQCRLQEDEGFSRAEVHADLGLAAGHFKYLADVRIPKEEQDVPSLLERLKKGEGHFLHAMECPGNTTNAALCLGIVRILEENCAEASDYLCKALHGAVSMTEEYEVERLVNRIHLYYAISLFILMDESRFVIANDALKQGLSLIDKKEVPAWLLGKAMNVIELADNYALELLETLHAWDPSFLSPFLQNKDLLHRSQTIYQMLLERGDSEVRDSSSRWDDLLVLLRHCLAENMVEEAGQILDRMEILVHHFPQLGEVLIGLLSDVQNVDPVLNEEDCLQIRSRILFRMQRFDDFASLQMSLFWICYSDDRSEDALDIFLSLQDLGLGEKISDQVRATAATLLDKTTAIMKDDLACWCAKHGSRIIFLGGNETQAQYDAEIKNKLAVQFPGLAVSFVHSGWGSNWNVYLDQARRMLSDHDGIVLMSMMRTTLGKKLRKLVGQLDKIWVSCNARGQQGIYNAILKAADLVRGRHLQK